MNEPLILVSLTIWLSAVLNFVIFYSTLQSREEKKFWSRASILMFFSGPFAGPILGCWGLFHLVKFMKIFVRNLIKDAFYKNE